MATARLGKPRPSGQPSSATERKIRILLELLRNKSVSVVQLCSDYGMSERSVLRDFQELRKIGTLGGFTLSDKVENGRISLAEFDSRPTSLGKSAKALQTLIRDVAHALGKPVESELSSLVAGADDGRHFLRFIHPTLCEGTRVTEICKELETAWSKNARVRFRYKGGKERWVEPYFVVQRSGRYYLLGRDLDATGGGWRRFALDEIRKPIARIGTFTPKAIPQEHLSEDTLGWIKQATMHEVSVRLSKSIAPSATSRLWQRDQRIALHRDGSATMTFQVSDVDEVVRWSLGFGADATIVGPPHAVDRARGVLQGIEDGYAAAVVTA